jgi:hypothetical protein
MPGDVWPARQPESIRCAEMAYAFSISNPHSNQVPTVQRSAKPLKVKGFYALTRVGVCWRDEAVPKPLCRHIDRCRDIGVRHSGRCRAFSCWTAGSSVSYRGGPRRRRAPQSPHGLPAAPAGIEGLLIYLFQVLGEVFKQPTPQCCVSAQGFSLHAEVWLGGLACSQFQFRFESERR